MNAIRLIGVGLVVGLLAAGARAEEKVDYAKLLVGKWEVTKADENTVGKGTIIEFTKDGKIIATGTEGGMEMRFEGTYKLEKNTFTLTMKVGDQEHTQTITIKQISDKEMSTEDKDGKKVDLARKK